jgi:hypothetical protein
MFCGPSNVKAGENIGSLPFIFILGSLRSATRPAQRRGLNISSRMRSKRFDYCNKYLTIFQITLQTATFG